MSLPSLCTLVGKQIYSHRQPTLNFELWVEIFCVPTCFHVRIPKPCLSVCPYPEKRNHLIFVNISPTLVIDTSMERSSRVLYHGNPKIWFFFSKKFEIVFWLVLKSWNHSSRSQHAPYDDIGDASSSLWGSTSSLCIELCFLLNWFIWRQWMSVYEV